MATSRWLARRAKHSLPFVRRPITYRVTALTRVRRTLAEEHHPSLQWLGYFLRLVSYERGKGSRSVQDCHRRIVAWRCHYNLHSRLYPFPHCHVCHSTRRPRAHCKACREDVEGTPRTSFRGKEEQRLCVHRAPQEESHPSVLDDLEKEQKRELTSPTGTTQHMPTPVTAPSTSL